MGENIPEEGEAAALSVINTLYESVLHPERWEAAIREIAAYCAAEATLIPFDPSDTARQLMSLPDSNSKKQYYEHWWRECPLRHALETELSGAPRVLDDGFLSDADLDRHPYYQEFLRPFGLRRRQHALLQPEPGRRFLFGLLDRIGSVGREDRTYARRRTFVTPYVEHALSLTLMFERERERDAAASLRDAFWTLGNPAAILDADAHPLLMNGAFERMLGDALVATGGRILPTNPNERSAFEGFLRTAAAGGAIGADTRLMRLGRSDGGSPLLLRAMPLSAVQAGTLGAEGRGGSRNGVLVVSSRTAIGAEVEPLLVVAGLTHREAQAARLVGNGQSPQSTAELLGVTVGTLRQMLKLVFAKLDVSTQSQLAVYVSSLVPLGQERGR